ncbi:uncharacterized protein K444DRAFT_303446 [Hyaloscypha bicolor E]|uniref:Secreted protein n=1 Tax=Hyaloscypha bicolor E TaxID=1095630 RepID=A0A2J6TND3_9HELO|nr:uncharacterized protein K444DRAFT_303446 [Hyaloscypha bicolor E]PMD64458.1 hypothetical protein K444DRAFT_303446 [Hyaloscypha bicolor E]
MALLSRLLSLLLPFLPPFAPSHPLFSSEAAPRCEVTLWEAQVFEFFHLSFLAAPTVTARTWNNPPSPTNVPGCMAWSVAGNTTACSCHPPPRRLPSHSHGEVLNLCCFPPSTNQHPTFTASNRGHQGPFQLGTTIRTLVREAFPLHSHHDPPNERRSTQTCTCDRPQNGDWRG